MQPIRFLRFLSFCFLIQTCELTLASPPVPFNAEYEVRFLAGLRADAELSLEVSEQDEYIITSLAKLKVLGKSITTVSVNGDFIWEAEKVVPQNYEYIQTGIGRRTRSIDYDWQSHSADTVVKGDEHTLPLAETMFDELSMYIEIQQQAAAGVEDIYLNVIDEDEIKEYHYKFLAEEALETDLGLFNTLKYTRVREPESKRETNLWLATDWHYLVVQLSQKTSVRTFQINLLKAIVNNATVVPLN
jgi:hypothetical protein